MYFSIILSLFLLSSDPPLSNDCDNVEVTFQTASVSTGELGEVTIELTGVPKGPIYYIFYYPSGHLVTEDVTKSTLNNLKPGKYFCSVVYNAGCTKKIEFEIKEKSEP